MAHILVVDDEKNYRTVLGQLLADEGHRVSTADNPFAALELLSREQVALILSDLKMPRMNGLEFLQRVQADFGAIPFVMLTAFATVETALETMKAGAFDYLLKPFNNQEILLVVEKALAYARLESENDALRRQLKQSVEHEILGRSPAIRRLLEDISRVAPARTSVLITGETGTGKELVARALHRASPREAGPLVTVNCAAFAETLLESELFGHERGAFTGASERKRGLLEVADGGTLFLDEIGEFPLPLQAKLLRVLQERRFRRVGGTAEIESDVRIITATHRDLREMIAAGGFREDLFYRLNVVTLQVPPLREHPEDIPLLATEFLRRFAGELGRPVADLAPPTLEALQRHGWPGNVRELQNVIERGMLFCTGNALQPEDLPEPLGTPREQAGALPWLTLGRPLPELLEEVEGELIRKALVSARGVQAQAAELLGISRSNLQYKLKKYRLE
ncbi:acetoacetate metabolism regulatory protein AtoC [Desulfuromonas versatilis]|uniref:Acetoacetate metabolism regulatory protein AtoC n=1 Tax=Desulfuromonas versatilis TaxID=2802975 RepID=A0ABN6E3H0_9BACT|nr:sigma-54 dependent transcriptional regulator [Desulfuromonas versatilis]BCR06354.1 acetoacetate metabolism regulatory protein AtoC [Desulfuromonas versatilis]